MRVEIPLQVCPPTDEQLVLEASREGSDGPAFVELVHRHQQRVWQICYRLLGNEHDAQDAAQEVFVRLFLHLQSFQGRSRFSTWLHAIAVRTCLSLRRSRGRRARRETTAEHEVLENVGGASQPRGEQPAEVYELLDVLDEEDRAMLILKYAEDYTFEELAEIFNLTTSACKMRAMRARQRIQDHFGTEPSGPDS